MEDTGTTAWWVRRLGVAAVIASLAFALGGLAARHEVPETSPEAAAPSAGRHYGPNPAYRLTPQIDRIIRLAQRNKLDNDKSGSSGGTQFKTAPVPKKDIAPTLKKQTTPTFKKKETAPVLKKKVAPVKKDTAPVLKKKAAPVKKEIAPVKKDTAPVIKKEVAPVPKKEIAPVTKEVAPETTAPSTGPTEQQLQENEAFCAKYPNDPSCSKDAPPAAEQPVEAEQPPAATEKICAANPKYPGCDKLGQPSLGPAPGEEPGQVGSICEQNPQLPQCQGTQETTQPGVPGGRPEEEEEAVEGPPGAPDEDVGGGPPGFIPPGAPAPVPPGPPPPPPTPTGDETPPQGPTIHTVTDECPAGQRLSIIGECFAPCPEGSSWYAGPGPNHNTCVAECPAYENGYADDGTGQCRQCYGGTIADGQCQCNAPYVSTPNPNAYSFCEPCNQVIYEGQCVAQCPQGLLNNQGVCVAECPEGRVQGEGDYASSCVLSECPEGTFVQGQSCVAQCGEGYVQFEGQCRFYCPEGLLEHEGQCLSECPSSTIAHQGQCLTECPDNTELILNRCVQGVDCPGDKVNLQTGESFEGECVDACPEGMLELEGRCIGSAVCGMWGGINYEGQCLESCPEGAFTLEGGIGCTAQCPSSMITVGNQCSTCPEGQHVLNNECRPVCGYGQVDVAGTCRPMEEVSYEELIQSCVESGAPLESNLSGIDFSDQSIDRQCQIMVDLLCGADAFDADSPACADREPACATGEYLQGDGDCTDECSAEQVQFLDTMCLDACPFPTSTFRGECRVDCPPGYESVDGQCVTGCGPGLTAGADGQCTNPCPEGQTFHQDQCLETCPEGEGYGEFNSYCRTCNTPGADIVHGDVNYHNVEVSGLCTRPNEVPYEDALATCMGGGYGYGMPGGSEHTEAECEQAIAGQCQLEDFENSRFCAELPEGAAPPPPDETDVAEGPTDGEAPPDGAAPPPPDEMPSPDEGAPPPEDETPVVDQPPPHSGCPEGTYVLENAQNGGCMPQCPPGTVAKDNGYCVAELPGDQAPPPPVTGEAPPPPVTDGVPPAPTPTAPVPGKPEAPIVVAKPAPGAATGAPVAVETPRGKPVAVVIGIGDYKDSGIAATPQAIGNAAHVVRFLKDDLSLDDLRIVTGRNAGLAELEAIFGKTGDTKGELRELMRKENPSEVIVYISGRALAADGGKDVLLLPADADPKKPETALSLARLYNQLAAMGVPRLRFYFDPAFVESDEAEEVKVQAGPMIGPAGILTPRGWIALSGASDNAALDGDPKRPRSLFTESLIAGLRGIADTTGDGDGDGTITAKELYEFTRDQAAAALKRGDTQPVPSLYGPPKEPLRAY